LQEGDEGPHRQPARHDPRAALPDQQHAAAGDEELVERLEAGAQPHDAEVGDGLIARQRGDLRDRRVRASEEAQQADARELLLDEPGERGVGRARGGGAAGDAAPGRVAQQQRKRRGGEGEERQAGVEQQHRDDEGEGEEDGVPGLDDELTYPDAEHLDVADDPRHQVADRRPVQVGQRAGEDAAHGVGAQVGPDARVRRAEPPALQHARSLAQEGAAQERQRRPADGRGWRFPALEGEGGVDRAAEE